MNEDFAKSSRFVIPNIFDSLEVELQETMNGDGPFTLMEVLRIHNYVSTLFRRQGSNSVSSLVSGSI
jgi:hypothetical protein